jgi:hypothetical protein
MKGSTTNAFLIRKKYSKKLSKYLRVKDTIKETATLISVQDPKSSLIFTLDEQQIL